MELWQRILISVDTLPQVQEVSSLLYTTMPTYCHPPVRYAKFMFFFKCQKQRKLLNRFLPLLPDTLNILHWKICVISSSNWWLQYSLLTVNASLERIPPSSLDCLCCLSCLSCCSLINFNARQTRKVLKFNCHCRLPLRLI